MAVQPRNIRIEWINLIGLMQSRVDYFKDVEAADDDGLWAIPVNIATVGVAQLLTLDGQVGTEYIALGVPRTVRIKPSAAVSATLKLHGWDAQRRYTTHTYVFSDSAVAQDSTPAFALLWYLEVVEGHSDGTVTIGNGAKLGLRHDIFEPTNVLAVSKNWAAPAVPTGVVVAGSIVDVGAIADGDDFTVFYQAVN